MTSIGLYIHIPFCRQKCPYCDFYSEAGIEKNISRYISAVSKELKNTPYHFDTLFIGGGTPSLLSARDYEKLFCALDGKLAEDAEITIESNPADLSEKYLSELRKNTPINRISVGVQSVNDETLKFLGRRHNKGEAERAVEAIKSVGFDNFSVDFMIGLPNETEKDIENMLLFAEKFSIPHLSSYLLKVEENTPFYLAGVSDLLDEDKVSDSFALFSRLAREKGYSHYEISNFSKKGYECKHNLKYWRCKEYLGIGPAAHSFLGSRRFSVPRDTEKYISDTENGLSPYTDFQDGGDESERLMLSLRLKEGVRLSTLSEDRRNIILKKAPMLINAGYIEISNDILSITEKGFLLSNSIICELIF
jgi:oxygen-independent coproporphyrinogen-3 oxidase